MAWEGLRFVSLASDAALLAEGAVTVRAPALPADNGFAFDLLELPF